MKVLNTRKRVVFEVTGARRYNGTTVYDYTSENGGGGNLDRATLDARVAYWLTEAKGRTVVGTLPLPE